MIVKMLSSALASAGHLLVAPLVSVWLTTSNGSWRTLPTPGEYQRSSAPGHNADRLLLIGSGISVGYGVSSDALALGGYLSRSVTALTGRGTSIETFTRPSMRAEDVIDVLDSVTLARYDEIVLTLGSDEAVHLTTVRSFGIHLDRLFDWVAKHAPHRLGIVMIGIPDYTSIMKMPALMERAVRRHCVRLDTELRRHCAERTNVTYVEFSPAPANLQRDGDRRFYEAWAGLIAPGISAPLNSYVADPRDPATIFEMRRQQALDELQILDTPAEPRFDRIVEDARRAFGVQGASITFIDKDRQWSKASIGFDAMESPRGSALGDATVNNGKLFVVNDARSEDHLSGHPWVTGASAVRFFAGFPIESEDGERVGALCICDPNPRDFTQADDALLGLLARQVQAELWGRVSPRRPAA